MFYKLYRWFQIAQRTTYPLKVFCFYLGISKYLIKNSLIESKWWINWLLLLYVYPQGVSFLGIKGNAEITALKQIRWAKSSRSRETLTAYITEIFCWSWKDIIRIFKQMKKVQQQIERNRKPLNWLVLILSKFAQTNKSVPENSEI